MSELIEFLDGICVSQLTIEECKSVYAAAERLACYQMSNLKELTNPESVRGFLRNMLMGREAETFGVVFLDAKHRVIQSRELFHGTLDGASVYPREVVKEVLLCNAGACILYHNHPSGVVEPSSADKNITLRLKEALALIDVRLLDHFIVGRDGICSFAERGLL